MTRSLTNGMDSGEQKSLEIKERFRKECDKEFPDIFNLPEGGMSVWLEESYTEQMKDFWLSKIDEYEELMREFYNQKT